MADPSIVTAAELNARQLGVRDLYDSKVGARELHVDWMDFSAPMAGIDNTTHWKPSTDLTYLSTVGGVGTRKGYIGVNVLAATSMPIQQVTRFRAVLKRRQSATQVVAALRRANLGTGATSTISTLTTGASHRNGFFYALDSGVLAVTLTALDSLWVELTSDFPDDGFGGAIVELGVP